MLGGLHRSEECLFSGPYPSRVSEVSLLCGFGKVFQFKVMAAVSVFLLDDRLILAKVC